MDDSETEDYNVLITEVDPIKCTIIRKIEKKVGTTNLSELRNKAMLNECIGRGRLNGEWRAYYGVVPYPWTKTASRVINFIGDSNTHGTEPSPCRYVYPRILELDALFWGYFTIMNTAISGTTTAGWKGWISSNIIPNSPKIAIIMLGTNDANNISTPTQYRDNIRSIINQLKSYSASIKIMLITAAKVNSALNVGYRTNETLQEYANVLKQIGVEYGLTVYDMFGVMNADVLDSFYNGVDGIHLNDKGQNLLSNAVKSWLETI